MIQRTVPTPPTTIDPRTPGPRAPTGDFALAFADVATPGPDVALAPPIRQDVAAGGTILPVAPPPKAIAAPPETDGGERPRARTPRKAGATPVVADLPLTPEPRARMKDDPAPPPLEVAVVLDPPAAIVAAVPPPMPDLPVVAVDPVQPPRLCPPAAGVGLDPVALEQAEPTPLDCPNPGEGRGPAAIDPEPGPGLRRGALSIAIDQPLTTAPTDPILRLAADLRERLEPLRVRPASAEPFAASAVPATPSPTPAGSAPAGRVFAHAKFAAVKRPPADSDLLAAVAQPPQPGHAPVGVDLRPPPLDTTRSEWIQSVVDRIETLRDAADMGGRETRIRLSPDALGSVEIAIREDGDTLAVTLTAATPEARSLLADAAPRLTDMAEARGLKLGQTSVEQGGGQPGGDPRGQQRHAAPIPPSAANDAAEPVIDDIRIA